MQDFVKGGIVIFSAHVQGRSDDENQKNHEELVADLIAEGLTPRIAHEILGEQRRPVIVLGNGRQLRAREACEKYGQDTYLLITGQDTVYQKDLKGLDLKIGDWCRERRGQARAPDHILWGDWSYHVRWYYEGKESNVA